MFPKTSTPKPKPRTIEVVKSTYQPTKAEREEVFSLDIPGDTVMERMQNMARALTDPVKIRWIDRPRKRS